MGWIATCHGYPRNTCPPKQAQGNSGLRHHASIAKWILITVKTGHPAPIAKGSHQNSNRWYKRVPGRGIIRTRSPPFRRSPQTPVATLLPRGIHALLTRGSCPWEDVPTACGHSSPIYRKEGIFEKRGGFTLRFRFCVCSSGYFSSSNFNRHVSV